MTASKESHMNSEQAKAHEIEASGSRDEPASPPQDEVTELAQAQEKHDDKTEPAAELEYQDDEAVAHSSESENAASTTAGVHKGQDGWTAVWDPSSNAYYFYNASTGVTTWENPLNTPEASTSTAAASDARLSQSESRSTAPEVDYGGIDPDLAYLDPNLSRRGTSGAAPSFQARFNARTGKFQADPTMNPDRISDYSRANRQQEVFYDPNAWQASLDGKGLQRNTGDSQKKRKPSTKEVEDFKARKETKKRKKLMEFLSS